MNYLSAALVVMFMLIASTAHAIKLRDDDPERQARLDSFWAPVFQEPEHVLRLDAGLGWHWWELASEGSVSSPTYRIRGGLPVGDWILAEATLDLALKERNAGPLTVQNNLWGGSLGIGYGDWFGAFRMSALATAGMVVRTSSLEDQSGTSYASTLVDPTLGARAGVGLGFFRRAVVNLDFDATWYSNRTDTSLILSLGWLFGG